MVSFPCLSRNLRPVVARIMLLKPSHLILKVTELVDIEQNSHCNNRPKSE